MKRCCEEICPDREAERARLEAQQDAAVEAAMMNIEEMLGGNGRVIMLDDPRQIEQVLGGIMDIVVLAEAARLRTEGVVPSILDIEPFKRLDTGEIYELDDVQMMLGSSPEEAMRRLVRVVSRVKRSIERRPGYQVCAKDGEFVRGAMWILKLEGGRKEFFCDKGQQIITDAELIIAEYERQYL